MQVERLGVERSRAAAANADIVVMVVDAQVCSHVLWYLVIHLPRFNLHRVGPCIF